MKRLATILLAGLILVGGIAATAAGGTASDPLISQSYLGSTYIPAVVTQAGERIDAKTGQVYDNAATRLKAQAELQLARAGALKGEGGYAATFTEQRFKRGDIITLDTGSGILLLAGSASALCTGGAMVDVTDGTSLPADGALKPRHRYLAGENTLCRVTITSDTAVLAPQGYFALTPSTYTDYNELAVALKSMGMFKGGDTAYGSGFALENVPTRIEGLIMFLRLIGEENQALAVTAPCPFVDAPDWCKSYVTYAYEKGYTKGVGADTAELYFMPQKTISAGEYLTFVLRALGYRDSGEMPDFSWDTAVDRAQALGVITAGERQLLTGQTFLRAQVVYTSYYALSAPRKTGGTLLTHLIAVGALDGTQTEQTMGGVTVKRVL
ncbi:MAG: hypothetical protein RRY53_01075 [Pseudoflavonifractor sp.]